MKRIVYGWFRNRTETEKAIIRNPPSPNSHSYSTNPPSSVNQLTFLSAVLNFIDGWNVIIESCLDFVMRKDFPLYVCYVLLWGIHNNNIWQFVSQTALSCFWGNALPNTILQIRVSVTIVANWSTIWSGKLNCSFDSVINSWYFGSSFFSDGYD